MKKLALLAALPLLLAGAARADDPPAPKPAAPAEAPKKHENKVSPEAKAAFERMAKAANGAMQKGLKEATGTIDVQSPQGPLAMKFTVKAPGVVSVETPGGGEKGGRGQMGGRGVGRQAETMLGYTLGVFSPGDDVEHDAELAKKDDKEVLTLTTFRDGLQTEKREITLDANGLAASAVVTRSGTDREGKRNEQTNELTYTWSKNGDAYRLDKIETKSARGVMSNEIKYVDAGGFPFPSSWKLSGAMGEAETKISGLVVNGKKVETPADAEKSKKKGEDEDDEEDEGHEKKEGGEHAK